MQSVDAAWTSEERNVIRRIAHNLLVSWKKESTLGNRTFTIGVSLIGGNDIIGINPGAIGSPANYKYFDESDYVTALAWERGLNMPVGGLSKALAEAQLDNTDGRFMPDYIGGVSELNTAILPRRPMIISAGFNFDGIDQVLPQFAGILTKSPRVNKRNATVNLQAADYLDFFQGKFLDQEVMFTGLTTDQAIERIFTDSLGMNTAQFDLEPGINVIPFGLFPVGTKVADILSELAEGENGHIFQDENGVFRFWNRQHWNNAPYSDVQAVIFTGQVIDVEAPSEDHIVNVVEVKGSPRSKEANQLVWQTIGFAGGGAIEIPANGDKEFWVTFDDPMLSVDTPVPNGTVGQTSFFAANTDPSGEGENITDQVYIKSIDKFATAAKITFSSNYSGVAYITNLDVWGRPARRSGDIYYRTERQASTTAYEERTLQIENDYIQSIDWARSFGQMIVNDYAFPENLQKITIMAMPELQMGDLVSWQGRPWIIFDIKTMLSPSSGFVQELTMLQRIIESYFRIGISTIGGSDKIAP